MIAELEVFQQLREVIESIGEAAVIRAGAKYDTIRPDEKPVGVIHSFLVKQMMVAGHRLTEESAAEKHSAAAADTDEEQERLSFSSARKDLLSDILADLVRYEINEEFFKWRQPEGEIHFRKDWMIAVGKKQDSLPDLLRHFLRG